MRSAISEVGQRFERRSLTFVITPVWTNTISGTCAECTMGLFRIIGPDKICVGTTTTLTTADGSATGWSSSNPTVGTVNSSGVVTGLTASASIGDVTITATNGSGCIATWPMTVVGVGELKADQGSAPYGPTNVVAYATNGVVTVTARAQPPVPESQLPACWSLTGGDGTSKLVRTVAKTNAAITKITVSAGNVSSNLWIGIARLDLDAGKNETDEENPGVYISANWNDDDGDGWSPTNQAPPSATYTPDKNDTAIPTGDTTFRSFTASVTPSALAGNVKLTFPANIKVWATDTKTNSAGSSGVVSGSSVILPATLYMEGVSGSSSFRDIDLTGEFMQSGTVATGVKDTIMLTVFEVGSLGFFSGTQQVDNATARHQFAQASSDMNGIISWDDANGDGTKGDSDPNCVSFHNCMEWQGTVSPSGVTTNQVQFELRREIQDILWAKPPNLDWITIQVRTNQWVNDDTFPQDEVNIPTAGNHLYKIDGPGVARQTRTENPPVDNMAAVGDLRNWAEVRIDGVLHQCSDFYKWHFQFYLEPKDATNLTRSAMSQQKLGSGWIPIPTSP